MTYRIVEWDNTAKVQRERDATEAEIAEIEERKKQAEKPDVPQSVTMLQARLQLIAAGLLDQANAYIMAMPGPTGDSARAYWEFAEKVVRDDPLVLTLCQHLGLSEKQADQLFIDAALLK